METSGLSKRVISATIQLSVVAVITVAAFVGGGLFANRSLDQIFEPLTNKIGAFKHAIEPTPYMPKTETPTPAPTHEVTPKPTSARPEQSTGVVTNVIDGDTIEVNINGLVQHVKYIGVDAPELEECYGKEAMEKNKSIMMGQTITLEKDVTNKDTQGNLLRYVGIGEYDPVGDLVELGYAKASSVAPDTKYQRFYDHAALQAKKNNRGLWAACATATPSPTGM